MGLSLNKSEYGNFFNILNFKKGILKRLVKTFYGVDCVNSFHSMLD